MSAVDLHREMVAYLYENGWTREEKGSGWFCHYAYSNECTLGEAVQEELNKGGIDTREEPDGLQSPSYWGEVRV